MSKPHHILALIEHLGLSVAQFEKEIGVGASTINKAIDRNSKLGFGTVHKILDRYKNVNKEWLETGKGDMLLSDSSVLSEDPNEYRSVSNTYVAQLIQAKNELIESKNQVIDLALKMANREKEVTNTVLVSLDRIQREVEILQADRDKVVLALEQIQAIVAPSSVEYAGKQKGARAGAGK